MTSADHAQDLEQRAAIHELGNKLPRHLAEEKAHQDYRREQLVEAAAHHLVGLKSAHAAGASDDARKHAVMYGLALRALGHGSGINPPPEVESRASHKPPEVYRFKPSTGDLFSLDAARAGGSSRPRGSRG
jgi:hypothetical protein